MSASQTQVSGLGSEVHLKKLQALSITDVEHAIDNKNELSASDLKSKAKSGAVPTSQGRDPVAIRSEKPTATSEELLSALGLGVEELSEAGRDDLRTITAVSEHLGLTTTEKAQVLATVAELRQRQWTAEDTKAEVIALRGKVTSQIKAIRAKIEDLKAVINGVDERQAAEAREQEEKQQRKMRFEVKSQNYVEELLQLEAKLKRTGFVPELSHDSLSARSARLAEEQKAVVALKEKLRFYRDLPPDVDAANQVFAAKLQQMQAATKQFEEGLAQL